MWLERCLGEMVGEVGLEPTKAKPADLQSAPFAARDTPPRPMGFGPMDVKCPGRAEARGLCCLSLRPVNRKMPYPGLVQPARPGGPRVLSRDWYARRLRVGLRV